MGVGRFKVWKVRKSASRGLGEGVRMRRESEKIILERESCPTAPKLWFWRVLSGVKLDVRHLPSVVGAGKSGKFR